MLQYLLPRLICFCLVVAIDYVPGNAQSRTVVFLNTGISLPIAPELFVDAWSFGFNVGAGFGYVLDMHQRVILQTDLNYSNYIRVSNDHARSAWEGTANILAISLNLKHHLRPPQSTAVPYIIGGGGLFRFSNSTIIETPKSAGSNGFIGPVVRQFPRTENKLGFGFGVGLTLNVTIRSGFFMETRYDLGLTEDEKIHYIPIKFGFFYR